MKNKKPRFMKWRRAPNEIATWRREQLETEYPTSAPPPPSPEDVPDALDYEKASSISLATTSMSFLGPWLHVACLGLMQQEHASS